MVIDKDPLTGRFQLSSLISYEIIRLPMGDFELFFEEGQGFVYRLQDDDDGDVVLVFQFFKRKVCFSDEEGYAVQGQSCRLGQAHVQLLVPSVVQQVGA